MRLYIPPEHAALSAGVVQMPEATARHVKALRLRPGDAVTVFDGLGGEWDARLRDVRTLLLERHRAVEREAEVQVRLAVGMPANERMDALVEKAVELGAALLQPLLTRRSVLRLHGERAVRRVAHWQAVAIAACEQCGRNRIPRIAPVATLAEWLQQLEREPDAAHRCLLSPAATTPLLPYAAGDAVWLVSGPEGGLDAQEQALLVTAGFRPVSLGPRVLRADTAPLAALLRVTTPCDPAAQR